METGLPEYYFRVRENGAAVFRVDGENRNRRIEMDQIAVVNLRKGEIKPHGGRDLSERDIARIKEWIDTRREVIARRELDDLRRLVDRLNAAAHWAQSGADDAELGAVTRDLLMAMHDLRSVLVRKKAERLTGGEE